MSDHPYISTREAAIQCKLHPSTFLHRARKIGIRYKQGNRIWDGYYWHTGDITHHFPYLSASPLRS